MDKIIECKVKYPELEAVAQDIANKVAQEIDVKAPRVESKMPDKAQCILELLINELQARV